MKEYKELFSIYSVTMYKDPVNDADIINMFLETNKAFLTQEEAETFLDSIDSEKDLYVGRVRPWEVEELEIAGV